MNQSSPKSGRLSGVTPVRVRSTENYLDALQSLNTPSQTASSYMARKVGTSGSGSRGCVLARSYQEKAAPKRLERMLPLGLKRVIGGAELLARLNTASLERVRRELRRFGTVQRPHARPRLLLAGVLGLGLSSAALADVQYQIQSGDSLWAIARAHDLTVDQLKTANTLEGDTIYAGEQLTIPGSASSGVAQSAQQARVAQKAALLNRLNNLKQERETRQQALGLSTPVSAQADSSANTTSNSASSVAQPVFDSSVPAVEVRSTSQQKLVNRLNQVISQDRRATQAVEGTVTKVDASSVEAASVDTSSVDASTNTDSTNTDSTHIDSSSDASSAAQKESSSLAEFKAKMQRTAELRAAKKAALLERIAQDRAAVKLAREQAQIKQAQAQLERQQKQTQLAQLEQQKKQAQQTRQIKLAQAQLERQQKRTQQASTPRASTPPASTPRVDAPLVNTSRHQARVRSAAYRYVGLRYRMGGTGRGSIDCSAFTQATLRQLGHSIPRTARAQSGVGTRVSFRNLRAGDLVFFNTLGRGVSHAGVYLGGGLFANANSYRGRVVVESIHARYWTSRFVTARRVLG